MGSKSASDWRNPNDNPGPGQYENERGTAIHENYNNSVGGNTIEKFSKPASFTMRPAATDHSRNYKSSEARGMPGPGDYDDTSHTVGSTSLEKFDRSASWGFGTEKR